MKWGGVRFLSFLRCMALSSFMLQFADTVNSDNRNFAGSVVKVKMLTQKEILLLRFTNLFVLLFAYIRSL